MLASCIPILTFLAGISLVSCGANRSCANTSLNEYHARLAEENIKLEKGEFVGGSFDTFSDVGTELAAQGIVIHHLETVKDVAGHGEDCKKLFHELAAKVHGPAVRISRDLDDKEHWKLEWYLIPYEDALANSVVDKFLHR